MQQLTYLSARMRRDIACKLLFLIIFLNYGLSTLAVSSDEVLSDLFLASCHLCKRQGHVCAVSLHSVTFTLFCVTFLVPVSIFAPENL